MQFNLNADLSIKGDALLTTEIISPEEAKLLKMKVNKLEQTVTVQNKRITNLEKGITPDPFYADDTVAYAKLVPANALPYAEVAKVGGMTKKSTNLIHFPYIDGGVGATKTMNGITFTVNADGSVTANGTATSDAYFNLMGKDLGLTENAFAYNSTITKGGLTFTQCNYTANNKISFIVVSKNKTVENQVCFPRINVGDVSLPYEMHFDGLRDAKVTAIDTIGQNVSDISSLSTGYFYDSGGQPTPTDRAGFLRFYAAKVRPNTTYTLTTNLPIYTIWEDDGANPTTIHKYYQTKPQKVTFTTESTCKRLRVSLKDDDQVGVSALQWCMLNVGSVALPYVPYDPNANKTLAIPSSVQDLDGYGLGLSATYHNYIDWETKTYVQEVKKYDLSKLGFGIGGGGAFYYTGGLKGTIKTNLLVSSHYVKATQNQAINMLDGEILISNGELYLKNSSLTSASQIVGEAVFVLATPIITDISDLLPDDNFIEVVGNGSVYAVNENADAVPTEITYMLKEETV